MSKSVLDHLIETTGRLAAAEITNGSRATTWEACFTVARAIVAHWAGPPCKRPSFYADGDAVYDPTPIDECENCGWPRSQHGG